MSLCYASFAYTSSVCITEYLFIFRAKSLLKLSSLGLPISSTSVMAMVDQKQVVLKEPPLQFHDVSVVFNRLTIEAFRPTHNHPITDRFELYG